ncbi:unnamed protein product [Durusdinium trenchii]|uniref:Uncharacterized protein n=1 Tax=Durusdinium trenchii TaxID=1381693 RepID=A0ABP0QPM0_9DINO
MDDLLPERLLFLADAPTCAALLRCSWRFAVVGRRAKERLQQGLVTEVTDSFRFYELHITVVRPKLPNGDLHGLEKGGCIPYRVGGPGEASFYSERWWCEGHLLSDCFWETNSWKYFARYEMHEICQSKEYEELPKPLPLEHPKLQCLNLDTYGVLCLRRRFGETGEAEEVWCPDFLKEDGNPSTWDMTRMESAFMGLWHFY